jgi:hypothetical protein
MAASFQFTSPGLPCKAYAGWVQDFRKEYTIKQRYVTKYISSKDNASYEETVKDAELLEKQTVKGPKSQS